MDGSAFFFPEVCVIVSPVMRQVGSYQDDITGLKAFDMVSYELSATALVKKDQFHFGMIMPAIVDEWVPVLPDAERMGGRSGDF